ncbi:MAG TPA: tripartite tricarboxylate transporter TctB family protein [Burkholderiales bacterium]|nr:tripartite tricarboxylate transporter TctB family protein [Burkholderiales bacterium]
MSRRAQENLVAVAVLAVFAGVVWLCQDFGPRARMIPLPLAIAGIVLTLLQILWQNLRSTEELRMDLIEVKQAPAEPGAAEGRSAAAAAGWRDEARALAIVGALIGLILALGPLPAAFLFTGGYLALTRQYSWRRTLVYTSLLTGSLYLLFVVALQTQQYHGLLAPLVERFR